MRFFVYLLIFLFAVTIGYSQITTIAQKHVKSYGPELSKGGEFIYEVASDNLGVLYFATDKGVVVYDGETWDVFSIKDTITSSLEYDSIRQRLWVGGYGNFGYLIKDSGKRYRYICLSDSVFKRRPFKQVWQILPSKDKVTFMSEDRHFVIRDDVVAERELKYTYVYEVGGIEYFSKLGSGTGLSILQGSELKKIWNQSPLKYESTFQIFALDQNNHLLFTPYDGVFIHHLPTNEVSRYTQKLNQLMIDNEFYHAYPLSDSILAIGTWKHGVVITDLRGNLVEQVTMNNGVLSNGVSDIIPDGFGKLWAATDYGISVIDIKATQPNLVIRGAKRPQTLITSLMLNSDSIFYWPTSDSNMVFERSPDYLQVNLATPALSYMADHKYLVQLEGYDSWHVSDNPNYEKYILLPNGTYTFKAKSLFEGKELLEASFSFTVNEPWYSSLVDASRYIGVSVVFVVLLIFVLTYNLRVSRNELTKLVSEKTRAIELQQQKLIEMNKSLVDTNDELDTFLYRSSHDLVAPVKSIKGLLMLMKMPNENSQTYIPMMEDRINRLELILSEINIYVKNVKQAPIKSAFLLKTLIDEIWAEVEFIPEAKKINFEIHINEQVSVESDRERWKMILSNLLVNAIKYHDPSKQNQFIKVITRKENGYLYILIEDNGQGIKKEHQGRLFEMFYRATTNSEGTGLGLFLVKKVVDSMKGTIHIESEFPVGTKVIIKVPADV